MKLQRQIKNELNGQEEQNRPRKERKTAREMKAFQRYLSSINKGSIVEVLDLPAADLDHLLTKCFIKFINKTDGDDWRRKTDGDDYQPDTLSGLQRGIQRFLSEDRSPFNGLSPFKRQLVTPEQYSSQHQQILLL